MKRGIIISFFVILISYVPLNAQDFQNTLWVSTYNSEEMDSFLLIELGSGRDCQITHAYLRRGEETPFDWDTTREEWYKNQNLIMILDSWGEFVPLTIIGSTELKTKIGGETIILRKITNGEKETLLKDFHLTGQ